MCESAMLRARVHEISQSSLPNPSEPLYLRCVDHAPKALIDAYQSMNGIPDHPIFRASPQGCAFRKTTSLPTSAVMRCDCGQIGMPIAVLERSSPTRRADFGIIGQRASNGKLDPCTIRCRCDTYTTCCGTLPTLHRYSIGNMR